MEKMKNLQDASSFWFFVMAFLYVAMVLALRNGFLADFFLSWMRILDLPFAFISLLYAASTLMLQLEFDQEGEIKSTAWFFIISLTCMILFGLVALMNFGFPAVL